VSGYARLTAHPVGRERIVYDGLDLQELRVLSEVFFHAGVDLDVQADPAGDPRAQDS
jgi:hypothetical protein